MSVSFKRPASPLIIRRNGEVIVRASGEVLGTVRAETYPAGWTYVDHDGQPMPYLYFRYATREDAASALHRESGGSR